MGQPSLYPPPPPYDPYYQPDVSRETEGGSRAKIPHVAVINQKGGVGKTTTAVSLSHGLVLHGKRVLLIDLDPQGNATTALGVEKYTTRASSYELLHVGEGEVPEWTTTRYEGLDLYPANISLIRAEMDLLQMDEKRDIALKRALCRPGLPHDVVIIDSPPSLGVLTLNILIASTHVLVPVQCEYLALEGLTMLLDTLDEIRGEHNPNLQMLGCLLTMVDLRTNLSQQIIKEMRQHLGDQVMNTLIPRTVRLSECPSHGKSIFEYERWGTGSRAYESFCTEVMDRLKKMPVTTEETAFG